MSFLQKISLLFADEKEFSDEHLLALDIGTTSVKAIVFKIERDFEKKISKAAVLGLGKALAGQGVNENKYAANMEIARMCREAKIEAENMAGVKVRQAIFSAAGQLIKGASNSEIYEREDSEKPIDLAEMKNIIQKAQWKIFNKIRIEETEVSGIPELETKLISGEIIEIKIDGYKVIDPIGFHGKELSLNILNIYSSLSYLKLFQRLGEILDLEIVALACQPLAILGAVANNIFKVNSFAEISAILIDCGGKFTDIYFASQGVLNGPKTLSIGGEAFTKRLASGFDLDYKEAEDLKIKYSDSDISAQIKRKITDAFNYNFRIWQEGVGMIFSDFSALVNFPSVILLCGGGALLPGIKKSLEDSEWQSGFSFLESVKSGFIKNSDLAGIEDKTGLLIGSQNIAALALANFGLGLPSSRSSSLLGLAKKESVVNSILNRVIRLMQN